MPSRPTVTPIWTVGNTGARTQPTDGEQFSGFVPDFRPPAGWHNWLFGIVSDWISWLDYITQTASAIPVSNVGHNILTGTTLQQQLDECDAFLSSLGLEYLTMTATANPAVYTLNKKPVNSSGILIFLDGLDEKPTDDFVYSVILGVPTITFGTAPSDGQVPQAITLTADQPGAGGSSLTGGFVVYGSTGSPVVVTASGGVASTSDQRALIFTVSSGGVVPITASPQISAGTKVGQELRLVGTSDANAITLDFGNGPIVLMNGVSVDVWWNGATWKESDRSN